MSPFHILVVDDEDVLCTNIVAFLEDEGFSVESANSGEQALDIIGKNKIDVGIMDMRLPGMDGNTLILKAHEIQPEMQFLVHTGSTNYNLPPSLKEIGISENQVFQKPLADMAILVEAIDRLLNNGPDNNANRE